MAFKGTGHDQDVVVDDIELIQKAHMGVGNVRNKKVLIERKERIGGTL